MPIPSSQPNESAAKRRSRCPRALRSAASPDAEPGPPLRHPLTAVSRIAPYCSPCSWRSSRRARPRCGEPGLAALPSTGSPTRARLRRLRRRSDLIWLPLGDDARRRCVAAASTPSALVDRPARAGQRVGPWPPRVLSQRARRTVSFRPLCSASTASSSRPAQARQRCVASGRARSLVAGGTTDAVERQERLLLLSAPSLY